MSSAPREISSVAGPYVALAQLFVVHSVVFVLVVPTPLVDSIAKEFGSALEVLGAQAGMHLAVRLPKGFFDQEVATSAARKGLWL